MLANDVDAELGRLLRERSKTLARDGAYPLLDATLLEDHPDPAVAQLAQAPVPTSDPVPPPGRYPTFGKLSPEALAGVRLAAQRGEHRRDVGRWLMRLHRYVEVRYATLRARERSAGRDGAASAALYAQVFAFFVEEHVRGRDLLYLNTALKVADLKWAVPTSRHSPGARALYLLKVAQLEARLRTLARE